MDDQIGDGGGGDDDEGDVQPAGPDLDAADFDNYREPLGGPDPRDEAEALRQRVASLEALVKRLVVERGSMVSHTAITGRMLGIPTVVAVAGATSTIADGDEIEIDGRSGSVRILRSSDQKLR